MNQLKRYCVFSDELKGKHSINIHQGIAGKSRALCGDYDDLEEARLFMHALETNSAPDKGKVGIFEIKNGAWAKVV